MLSNDKITEIQKHSRSSDGDSNFRFGRRSEGSYPIPIQFDEPQSINSTLEEREDLSHFHEVLGQMYVN